MSVIVRINESEGSYVLSFTGSVAVASLPAIEPSDAGIAVYLTEEDAIVLHDRLGEEIKCDDCPCHDYGFDQGRDFERS